MTTKEYVDELMKAADAGLDDAGKQAVQKFFSIDKVSNAFVPRPEVDRSLDQLKREWNKIPGAQEWYQNQLTVASQNEQAVNEAKGIVQKYVDTYGELPDAASGNRGAAAAAAAANFISKKDHDEAMARQGSQYLSVLKTGLKATGDYYSRFGKPLDVDALEKFALEKHLPLETAYQEFIRPELDAKQNTAFEEKLKAAKEEGYKDGLSKANVPTDSSPKQPHPFFDSYKGHQGQAKPSGGQLQSAFLESWAGASK